MIPQVLVAAGVVALVAGWLAMRRIGAGARIGRILAVTPVIPVARARALAEAGTARFIAVEGRLDAESPFEDEGGRPLVLRRTRLEARSGSGGWQTVVDEREMVPFGLSEGLASIAIEGAALDEGLVVVRRESEGTAGEIPDRLPAGTPPGTLVRLRIEILSTVDHALALGVPVLDPAGDLILGPGLGRPLILTTLERDDAMRLLAVDRHGTARLATGLLAAGLTLLVAGFAWAVIDAVA